MTKLECKINNAWVANCHPPTYEITRSATGRSRIVTGAPAGDPDVFAKLCECMQEPLFLLYILHTPRGEGEAGRYQSPELSHVEVAKFVTRFTKFLANDGRFDLWAHSPSQEATVVWDRHNSVFAYPAGDDFERALRVLGFQKGSVPTLGEHIHHYRHEFDADAAAVLADLAWQRTPLRPEDVQFTD